MFRSTLFRSSRSRMFPSYAQQANSSAEYTITKGIKWESWKTFNQATRSSIVNPRFFVRLKTRLSRMKSPPLRTPPVLRSSTRQERSENKRRHKARGFKMLWIIVLVFLICWSPYFVMIFYSSIRQHSFPKAVKVPNDVANVSKQRTQSLFVWVFERQVSR